MNSTLSFYEFKFSANIMVVLDGRNTQTYFMQKKLFENYTLSTCANSHAIAHDRATWWNFHHLIFVL